MAVTIANDNNLQAWQDELNLGLDAVELLEEARYILNKMSGSTEALRDIDDAIFSSKNLASRAALRVARLQRSEPE